MTTGRGRSLEGKVALVTGASRGIGLAVAARCAAAGASVMISARKGDALHAAVAEIGDNVSWFAANAGEKDQVDACVDECVSRYGRVDLLVNSAATNPHYGPLVDLDVARAEKTMRVNLLGPLLWVQAVWRASMVTNGGTVVNIASIGGRTVEPGIGWYNASKAALIHLTTQLAYELGPKVRVNAVAPGLVKTEMARALWESREHEIAGTLPLRRIGVPNDIASAVMFLATNESSWITGQTIFVDGGTLTLPPVSVD